MNREQFAQVKRNVAEKLHEANITGVMIGAITPDAIANKDGYAIELSVSQNFQYRDTIEQMIRNVIKDVTVREPRNDEYKIEVVGQAQFQRVGS